MYNMDGLSIGSRILRGTVVLDSLSPDPGNNTFIFAVEGRDVSVSAIISKSPKIIRVYRGYGSEVAKYKPENLNRKLHEIEEGKSFYIAVIDPNSQEIIDKIEFKGKVVRDADALLHKFRMETVMINVESVVGL